MIDEFLKIALNVQDDALNFCCKIRRGLLFRYETHSSHEQTP